jgi:hypothetical protein
MLSAARPRSVFGKDFVEQVKAMGVQQLLSAPRCPWQRAYVERLIGSIRFVSFLKSACPISMPRSTCCDLAREACPNTSL